MSSDQKQRLARQVLAAVLLRPVQLRVIEVDALVHSLDVYLPHEQHARCREISALMTHHARHLPLKRQAVHGCRDQRQRLAREVLATVLLRPVQLPCRERKLFVDYILV